MINASVRIFTPDLKLEGVVANYESLVVEDMWYGVGIFQMTINRHKKHVDKLQKGNILSVNNDYNKPYIILHKEIELTERGKITENWLIRGMELKIILGRRITLPPAHTAYDNRSGDVDLVMRHYINGNAVSPIDAKRRISQLLLSEKATGTNISWSSRLKNLAEELMEMSVATGVGWGLGIDPTTGKYPFYTSTGTDRSFNQSANSPIIFSPQAGNLLMTKFMDSDLNYNNMAYVAGQGEGVERRIVEVRESTTGLNRYEMFVDARDVEETYEDENDVEQPRPEADIIKDLTDRGNARLAEVDREIFFEGQVLPNSPLNIKYFVGDIATVQNRDWNITMDTRIAGSRRTFEASNVSIELIFGNNRPNLITKLKQELRNMNAEVTR